MCERVSWDAARARQAWTGAHLRALEPLRALRALRRRGGACLVAAVDELWWAQEWFGDAASRPAAQLVEQAREPLRHVHPARKSAQGCPARGRHKIDHRKSIALRAATWQRRAPGHQPATRAECDHIRSAPVPRRTVTSSAILAGTMMGKGLRSTRPRRGRLGQAQPRPAPRNLHASRSAPDINSHAPSRPHPLGATSHGMQTTSGQHFPRSIPPGGPIDRTPLRMPTTWTFVKLNGQLPIIPTADGLEPPQMVWTLPPENPAPRVSDEPAPCPWPPPCTPECIPEYTSPAARRSQPTSSPTTEQRARRKSVQDTSAKSRPKGPSPRPVSSPEFIRAELPMLSSPPGGFVAALRAAAASYGDNAAGSKRLPRDFSTARFLATCEPASPPAMLVASIGSRPWMRRSARGSHAPDIDAGSTGKALTRLTVSDD